MKIRNIKVNAYGTLKEKEISLENQINIIYGKNESGKSTLLNFIKNMFYGISKNKNGKEQSDYEKYLPWTTEEFSGKLKYELEEGKSFEIYRDFHKKSPKLFNENLEEISGEYKIDKKEGNLFFQEQTGINEQMYTSTIMTAQQEVVLDRQSQNILVQRIANLGGTGEEGVCFQRAMDKLNKRQIEEVGTTRTQDRPINLLQNRSKQIELALKEEQQHLEKKQNLQEEIEVLEEKIKQEVQKRNFIQEMETAIFEKELAIEKKNLKEKIKKENEEKLDKMIEEENLLITNQVKSGGSEGKQREAISQQRENIKNKIKTNQRAFATILIILIVMNLLLNFIWVPGRIINYFLLAFIPFGIILFLISHFKNKEKMKQLEQEIILQKQQEQNQRERISIYDSQIELLRQEIKMQEQEIAEEKKQIEEKTKMQKQKIQEKYPQIIEERLWNIEKVEILKYELEKVSQRILEKQLELNNRKQEEKVSSEQIEKITLLKEEQEQVIEKLTILEQKNKCMQATKQLLERAYEKMKSNVTPKFTQALSNMVKNISGGKYQKVVIHEEKGLIVELENGEYLPANCLSVGTIDQLYLSLRLSMLEEIAKEKMPIILDETFAYFDDERLKNSLTFLLQKAKDHQIILLTCSKREKQILDSMKIAYHWVEL